MNANDKNDSIYPPGRSIGISLFFSTEEGERHAQLYSLQGGRDLSFPSLGCPPARIDPPAFPDEPEDGPRSSAQSACRERRSNHPRVAQCCVDDSPFQQAHVGATHPFDQGFRGQSYESTKHRAGDPRQAPTPIEKPRSHRSRDAGDPCDYVCDQRPRRPCHGVERRRRERSSKQPDRRSEWSFHDWIVPITGKDRRLSCARHTRTPMPAAATRTTHLASGAPIQPRAPRLPTRPAGARLPIPRIRLPHTDPLSVRLPCVAPPSARGPIPEPIPGVRS
ncbi:hypothetical protein BH09PSE6_BH09PSE6_07160 [soil metagenome]